MNSTTLPTNVSRHVIFSQWAYWCSLGVAALSVRYIPAGGIRTTVMLVPILTAILSIFVAYWLYEASDEFVRIRLLRSVSVTAIIIALGTLGYFFLELTGFPRVSMLWINVIGWSIFNLQMILVIRRSR